MTKGEETKAAILDSAVSLATRIGLEGLSIGGLARETGLSKSGLFAHFASKHNLQLDVLETSVERFVTVVVAPAIRQPRGLPRVQALFENWIAWTQTLPGGCFFVAAANELDDRPGILRERLKQYQKDWLETLARAARIAVGAGHFRAELDTRQFAYDFYSVLLAYHLFSRLVDDPQAEARARLSFAQLLAHSKG